MLVSQLSARDAREALELGLSNPLGLVVVVVVVVVVVHANATVASVASGADFVASCCIRR